MVLRGLNAADWSITIFNRWGREILRQISCANQWKAAGQPAGSYFYLLTNSASGQTYKGWVEVVYWN